MSQVKKQSNQKDNKTIIELDAKGQSLGRIATQIAFLLIDKNKPSFAHNISGTNLVRVKNVKEIKFTGKKLTSKIYFHHTGHPGGLKEIPLETLFKKNPEEVLIRAVTGMLPKNKLKDQRIKRLIFVND
ncbi:MAG: 50S ribosomal protein L13 [Candidatus Paceibacterota bacterium]|jgi:large subunit ribosomal protein L13